MNAMRQIVTMLVAAALPAAGPAFAGARIWTGHGPQAPTAASGRIRALAVNPATGKLYAGTVSGTVFSYADPGLSRPPTAADDSAATNAGMPVTIDVVANDSDPEGTLAPSSVAIQSGPAHGGVAVNAVDGTVTYTPAAGFGGGDAFTYLVRDAAGAASNVATVSISVNARPVASDLSLTAYEGGQLTGHLPAADANGDVLMFSVTQPGDGAVQVTASTGAFTYTPAAGYSGAESFTFQASDGMADSNIATVSISVNPTPAPGNVAPAASDLALTAYQNHTLSGQLSASDANGDPLTFALVSTSTAHGAVTITDAATGAFSYTPAADYTGAASFTFKTHDGMLDSNTATVSITVETTPAPGNVAPVASDADMRTYESAAIEGRLTAADGNRDKLTFSIVAAPMHGQVKLADPATGAFIYTPAAGFSGNDSFRFKASDGHADSNAGTIRLTVEAKTVTRVPTEPSSDRGDSGGGGGLGWLGLLLLGGLTFRRGQQP